MLCYNYTVTQEFAEEIRNAVNGYYNISTIGQASTKDSHMSSTKYTLQDSTVFGSWVPAYSRYNCYAHALDKGHAAYNPGYYSGQSFSLLYTVDGIANLVEADLRALGYHCVKKQSTCPSGSSLSVGEFAICFRKGTNDYHFMKLANASKIWVHKPGLTHVLLYKYTPTNSRRWTNEAYLDGVAIAPTMVYASEIRYIIYSKTHTYSLKEITPINHLNSLCQYECECGHTVSEVISNATTQRDMTY